MSAAEIASLSPQTRESILSYLTQFVTNNKQEKFNKILSLRTRHINILLENIFHTHNANACIRSTECFGVQDIHIVEDRFNYKLNPNVLRGSAKWVTMHRHANTATAIENLKEAGYKIVATSPHEGSIRLEELPVNEKLAIAFGTEREGISEQLLDAADYKAYIPMYGFTESFNISVSAALVLHHLTEKLRLNYRQVWGLSQEEKDYLLLEWVIKTVSRVDIHIKKFFTQENKQS